VKKEEAAGNHRQPHQLKRATTHSETDACRELRRLAVFDIPLTFENVEDPDAITSDGPVATQLAGLISDTSAASALPGT
jgi:hypothetical protein